MKISGFTIVRNAITFEYPVIEAILSILAICDEFVVAVGASSDGTRALIESIASPKIRIVDTQWDDSLRTNGTVLALETNKAIAMLSPDTDWAFYIQADEVVHEKYLPAIQQAMKEYKDKPSVDGLLFKYLHFYGSYDYVASSARWYKNEIRVIKPHRQIYSYRDAQGFRKENNQKLKVKAIDAYIYHYGWVKDPRAMQRKQLDFNKLWHDDEWISKHVVPADSFDYKAIDQLSLFTQTHPKVMQERAEKLNWQFEHDVSKNKFSLKNTLKNFLYNYFNIEIGYKNYKKV